MKVSTGETARNWCGRTLDDLHCFRVGHFRTCFSLKIKALAFLLVVQGVLFGFVHILRPGVLDLHDSMKLTCRISEKHAAKGGVDTPCLVGPHQSVPTQRTQMGWCVLCLRDFEGKHRRVFVRPFWAGVGKPKGNLQIPTAQRTPGEMHVKKAQPEISRCDFNAVRCTDRSVVTPMTALSSTIRSGCLKIGVLQWAYIMRAHRHSD